MEEGQATPGVARLILRDEACRVGFWWDVVRDESGIAIEIEFGVAVIDSWRPRICGAAREPRGLNAEGSGSANPWQARGGYAEIE